MVGVIIACIIWLLPVRQVLCAGNFTAWLSVIHGRNLWCCCWSSYRFWPGIIWSWLILWRCLRERSSCLQWLLRWLRRNRRECCLNHSKTGARNFVVPSRCIAATDANSPDGHSTNADRPASCCHDKLAIGHGCHAGCKTGDTRSPLGHGIG